MILYFFYFFAAIQLVFSWKSLQGGFRYLRFFREEISRPPRPSPLMASVIVPCRGIDKGMRENLRAVMSQDHSPFEVIFVLDSAEDPAFELVADVAREFGDTGSRLVIAGKSASTGQKIHNLIEASKAIANDSEVLVFVDSDARPSPGWLTAMLDGLARVSRGCSSGYRWFIPEKGGFASQFRSAWNASIASTLGPDGKSNFSWGGSTAVYRSLFEELEVAKNWEGKLADDFALTRLIRESGGEIRFVPSCLTASVEDCTMSELVEFTTRQMKITRVYRPDLWAYSMIGSVLFLGTVASAFGLLFVTSGLNFALLILFLAAVIAAGTVKALVRLKAVGLALPGYRERVRRQAVWQATLWLVTPLLYLWNDLAALVSRRIVWRGIEYELESPDSTRIVRRKHD